MGFAQYKTYPDLPLADPDNGGLYLPGGFQALVVVDSLKGQSRHLAVNSNGDIYVKSRNHDRNGGFGNVALRDVNNDGKADIITPFGQYEGRSYGTAMKIYNGFLYFSSELMVYRHKLKPGQLVPDSKMDTIVVDDPPYHEHQTKPIAFDGKGNMYVGWGAGSNNCQELNRRPGSPGIGQPHSIDQGCPLLKDHGGIWMFNENKTGQKQADGVKYATGLRSIVAMEWDNFSKSLYAVNHGRDDFRVLWPAMYSPWESAMLPAEEFFKIKKGFDGGWPYYYYDQIKGKKLLNPEYGGDKKKEGNSSKLPKPLIGFPGHFAPNDILFYKGNQFPVRYKNGAFIAFHGATNRAPYPQAGYIIAFVPFKNGMPSGPWEVFADGFAGIDVIANVSNAAYRPMGLAEGPDGSLYISDTEKGKIWRVMFKGNKGAFGTAQLGSMAKRKLTASNLKTPDEIKDNLDKGKPINASRVYNTYCGSCHQRDGKGDGTRFPPLNQSEWVNNDKKRLISIVLNGLQGPIQVKGQPYNEVMPAHGSFLKDEEIAEVLTFIRSNFENTSDAVTSAEVAAVRKSIVKK
ncbi:MAG TPA: c-type cytochrome [Sphingobacteriaceae bacterium]|nr:c-type cytochrome [Sphingobacteriaceae bacterium]